MAAVLLLTLRLLVEARFVAAELLALRRLDEDEAFFLETRFFPLRCFSLPVAVSTNAVTALDAISFAAAKFILAASVNAPGTDAINPSFSLSMSLASLLGAVPPSKYAFAALFAESGLRPSKYAFAALLAESGLSTPELVAA